MNGKTYLGMLAKQGIPCSVIAMKAKTDLTKVYQLKHQEQVPQRYLEALKNLGNN